MAARTRPQRMKEHQGRANKHEINHGKQDNDQGPGQSQWTRRRRPRQERRDEHERAARADTTGHSKREKAQQMKNQPEERARTPATDWSIHAGAASNLGLDHSGGPVPVSWTGSSEACPEESTTPPGLQHLGSQEVTHPDPGVGHPGKTTTACSRAPQIGTSGGLRTKALDWNISGRRERPQTGTSGDAQEGGEGSGSNNMTPRNVRWLGERQQARDHPGQTRSQ